MLQLRGASAPSGRRVPYALVLALLALTTLLSLVAAGVFGLLGRRVPTFVAAFICAALGSFFALLVPFRDALDPHDGGDA